MRPDHMETMAQFAAQWQIHATTGRRRNSPALGLTDDGEKGLVSHPASGRYHRTQSLEGPLRWCPFRGDSRRPVRMSNGSYSSERKHSWPRNACFDSICLRMNFPKQGRPIWELRLAIYNLKIFASFTAANPSVPFDAESLARSMKIGSRK